MLLPLGLVSYNLHDWRGFFRKTGHGGGQMRAVSHSTKRLPVPIVKTNVFVVVFEHRKWSMIKHKANMLSD